MNAEQKHIREVARLLAEEAGFDVCELSGEPEVCSPSSDPDYGLLDHLAQFYALVKEQTLKELAGTDDPLMRPAKIDRDNCQE